jgi:hypothetical protein
MSGTYEIEWPEGFDDHDWEVEAKGWLQGTIAVIGQCRYQISFYDPTRLAQEIADEFRRGVMFFERSVVVVPSVTRAHMNAAVEVLATTGKHRDLVPDEGSTG